MTDAVVVLIFFNRPAEFEQVWQVVRQVKPPKLVAISDGPRSVEDQELINACRAIVVPDWECQLTRIYRDTNLGCRRNISEGLTEVFSREERAIVLEDDCVPDPSFFSFANQLLEKYESNPKIFSITGMNQFATRVPFSEDCDYDFSRYFCSWGWAAWRRSWELCQWDRYPVWNPNEDRLNTIFQSTSEYWRRLLSDEQRLCEFDSWAFQACLTGLRHNLLTIIPTVNLVDNRGLKTGVHFKKSWFINWKIPPVASLGHDLRHPSTVVPNDAYDVLFERRHFDNNKLRKLWNRVIEQLFHR